MRISVITETAHGACSMCSRTQEVTRFTISTNHGVESTPWHCDRCLSQQGEVSVDIEPPPPPKSGPPSRRVQKASRRNERITADSLGGRTTPGSGNQPGMKGDVRVRGRFRIENKDSYSNQFILKTSILDKIRGECGGGETPAVVVTFMEKMTHRPLDRWAIIPFAQWEEIANAGRDR